MGQDRRITRTKTALAQALFDLCREKDFARITVTELARRANVDRKTFYLHYRAVGDILEDFYAEHLARLQEKLERGTKAAALDVLGYFRTLSASMEENMELYRCLVCGPAYDLFRDRLREILRGRIIGGLCSKTVEQREVPLLCAEFFTDGVLGVYLRWLRGGLKLSGEELARQLSGVVTAGVTGLVR